MAIIQNDGPFFSAKQIVRGADLNGLDWFKPVFGLARDEVFAKQHGEDTSKSRRAEADLASLKERLATLDAAEEREKARREAVAKEEAEKLCAVGFITPDMTSPATFTALESSSKPAPIGPDAVNAILAPFKRKRTLKGALAAAWEAFGVSLGTGQWGVAFRHPQNSDLVIKVSRAPDSGYATARALFQRHGHSAVFPRIHGVLLRKGFEVTIMEALVSEDDAREEVRKADKTNYSYWNCQHWSSYQKKFFCYYGRKAGMSLDNILMEMKNRAPNMPCCVDYIRADLHGGNIMYRRVRKGLFEAVVTDPYYDPDQTRSAARGQAERSAVQALKSTENLSRALRNLKSILRDNPAERARREVAEAARAAGMTAKALNRTLEMATA